MAIPHALPATPVNLLPGAEDAPTAKTVALAKNDIFEAIRLIIPKGHALGRHHATGMITFQCLEGRIAFTAGESTHELRAGDWLFLNPGEPHSLVGLEESSALLTIMFR